MPKRDYRSEPVRRLVVLGESNAFGMCASEPRNQWVQVLANLIRDFQDEPVHVFNSSIPANVISTNSPGYGDFGEEARPCALERCLPEDGGPRRSGRTLLEHAVRRAAMERAACQTRIRDILENRQEPRLVVRGGNRGVGP